MLLIASLFLAGCGGSDPTPAPSGTAGASVESIPLGSHTPAATPSPSPSPSPTATPLPVPSPTAHATPRATATLQMDATPLVHFPRDEAAHEAPIEWWYFNGHLSEPGGPGYSFHFVGVAGRSPQGVGGRGMHLTLATPDEGVVVKAERAALGLGPEPADGFAMALEDWSMQGSNGRYLLVAGEGGYGFSLALEDTKAPVLHGEDGIIDMGPAGESYYYSRTRLTMQGTLTVGGVTRPASGEAWMDHQWGDFGQERVRWNWFSLQLDDGAELMVVLFWDIDSGEPVGRYGTYVLPSGRARYLLLKDIEVTPLKSWTSPNTGFSYPMGWRLVVAPWHWT